MAFFSMRPPFQRRFLLTFDYTGDSVDSFWPALPRRCKFKRSDLDPSEVDFYIYPVSRIGNYGCAKEIFEQNERCSKYLSFASDLPFALQNHWRIWLKVRRAWFDQKSDVTELNNCNREHSWHKYPARCGSFLGTVIMRHWSLGYGPKFRLRNDADPLLTAVVN